MKKRLIIAMICVALILMVLPQTARAADYNYIDENGDTQTITDAIPVTADTTTLGSGWYVVNRDVTRNATMTVSGDAKLILMDGVTLTVTGSSNNAGVNVSSGRKLTIYGQAAGTGTLHAQGGSNGAGIGGGKDSAGGTVVINGGTVNATGGPCGAGIGGGYYKAGGTTTITGGIVSATGGTDSAGIGGGFCNISNRDYSHGGTITITGGNVTAYGNGYGAGIGGGMLGSSGTITISGGTVNATSGDTSVASGGAGIGGGAGRGVTKITISGGTVVASALDYGAGIGGGCYGNGGIIEISDGSVTAASRYRGSGIGGGDMANGGTTTISGGTVHAHGGDQGGAGIGGGALASGGTINIQGGIVNATGTIWSAGIGGGCQGSGGTITVSGGTVNATGGAYGAGIGGGGMNRSSSHNGGTVKLLGGRITAKGGGSDMDKGLDIGRGRNGVNGTLLIDDAAIVTLVTNGIDSSVTTLGTCILKGSAAGPLAGVYEDGAPMSGTLIDLSSSSLASGSGYTVSGDRITLTGGVTPVILSDSTQTREVSVSSGVIANVVLFAADIDLSSGYALNTGGSQVSIKLIGDNRLKSGSGFAGLQMTSDGRLFIDGTGRLTAQGGSNGAGIGGGNVFPGAGRITIIGGEVTALGNGGGAGIGGGNGGEVESVSVDGSGTVVSATGGATGYDIGSGNGSSAGGSLSVNNGANLTLNQNGTNATAEYVTCTIGGEGAGLKAGTYLNTQKLITFSAVNISPSSDAEAFDTVTLSAMIDGLSDTQPEGKVLFKADGVEIGQASVTRTAAGSSQGTANIEWTATGGTHTFTAQYVQNVSDSYYTTGNGQVAGYSVSRIDQSALSVSDPGIKTYGYVPFDLAVSGGSGTGAFGYAVTSGDAVSVNSSGRVTVEKAGSATVTVTKAADDNYEAAEATVDITVDKAIPPALIFPTSGSVTYGAKLSDSALTGGSGDGGFAWESPDTVPPVNNSGYKVIFTPRDADNYDYTGFTLESMVDISVSKAVPTVTFPSASNITYGEKLSDSALTGGSGDGCFAWENPDTAPPVLNSGYKVIFTPNDTDNYLTVEQIVSISVNKAEQTALSISGIPGDIRYGDADFSVSVSGGSGVGMLFYQVTSGDAVTVDTVGKVSVIKPGTATLTVTKAGDSNYNGQQEVVIINVGRGNQTPLSLTGVPDSINYGDTPFDIIVGGGSGIGAVSYQVTAGDAVSVDASGQVTIEKAGSATVTVTKAADDNYGEAKVTVDITVNKATPQAVIFPTSSGITYSAKLSASALSSGSGDGSFEWENPDAVPTVNNSGYKVIFIPRDADNYDYSGFTLEKIIGISVNKAVPVVTFPKAKEIVYGGSLSSSVLSGGSGNGSFAWENPDIIPPVINNGYNVVFTPSDTDNYRTVKQIVSISVNKAEQTALSIGGIPADLRYGDADFILSVTGGNGTGALSYQVTSGDAVTVDAVGKVSVIKPGTAILTVKKAGDSNYKDCLQTAKVSVGKADQKPLAISGIPNTIRYGDEGFTVGVSGGSGTGELSYEVTSGDAVTVDAAGKVSVIKPGTAILTVTKAGDSNYKDCLQTAKVSVGKADQKPLGISDIPDTIRYGDEGFIIGVSGGSGVGKLSFEVTTGDAVTVDAAGKVSVIKPGTAILTVTKAGDSNFKDCLQTVQVSVDKADQMPLTISGIPSDIRYGDADFILSVTGGSGTGALSYEVTSGAVTVNAAGKVSVIKPGTAILTVTKEGDSNYNGQQQTAQINVGKGNQTRLSLTGIPSIIRYGDEPFDIIISGGSGTGRISYEVTSGDAVSVDLSGQVTVKKVGTATVTVTKAGDDFYNSASVSAEIQVKNAVPSDDTSDESAPLPSAVPSTTPTMTPSSTQTPLPNTRTIMGTLVDTNGNPMAGYVVELHSDPITTITDANGQYTFYNVDYTSHELIVKTPKGEEIAAFALSFSQSDKFATDVSEEGVDIMFTENTATVDIEVVVSADQSGAAISQVAGVENPKTGDSLGGIGAVLLWIGGSIFALAIIAALIIILRKRTANDFQE